MAGYASPNTEVCSDMGVGTPAASASLPASGDGGDEIGLSGEIGRAGGDRNATRFICDVPRTDDEVSANAQRLPRVTSLRCRWTRVRLRSDFRETNRSLDAHCCRRPDLSKSYGGRGKGSLQTSIRHVQSMGANAWSSKYLVVNWTGVWMMGQPSLSA